LKTPSYDINDLLFKTFVETICLGTICYFQFQAGEDDIKKIVAKKMKTAFSKLPDNKFKCTGENERFKQAFIDAEKELEAQEEKKSWIKRATEGDASETGLIKFIQPLFLDAYQQGGITGFREKHPIMMDDQKQLV